MSEDRINVAIEIGNVRVTLEGPRDFVESEVRRLTATVTPSHNSRVQSRVPQADALAEGAVSERDFLVEKTPKGHAEIVTALAFYLTEHGQKEFTDQDIRRAYIRAGIRPPKVVAQALRDAKNRRDFLKQGSARGTYRLTHHGDSFVRFDLGRERARRQ
jgi:hypothetical protein